jgi:anti-anti-sigma regulatory factor
VRGGAVCGVLARELDLHLVRGRRPPTPVRTRASVKALPSKRNRGAQERERISADGERSLVIELQGSLGFVAVETLAREALPTDGAADAVVVDLRRVQRIDPSVAGLLADLVGALCARGAAVAWSGVGMHGDVLTLVDEALAERRLGPPRRFTEMDLALEWAEDVVLSRFKGPAIGSRPERWHVPLAEHPAFAGLDRDTVECLERVMERRQFRSGEALVRHGEPAEELFVITGGRLSVWVPVGAQDARRLATLEAGQLVGELAFLGRERRTADVYCDTEVEAYVLTTAAFDALARSDPATTTVFLATLLRIVSGIARRMTAEVAHLAS